MFVLVCGVEKGESFFVVGLDEEGQSDEVVEQGLRWQHRVHFYPVGISVAVVAIVIEYCVGQHLVEVDHGVQLVVFEVDGKQVRSKDVYGGDVYLIVGLVGDQELERALDGVGEVVDGGRGRVVVEHAGAVGRVVGEHHLPEVFRHDDDRREVKRRVVQQPLREEVDQLRLTLNLGVHLAALERYQQVHAQQKELLEVLVVGGVVSVMAVRPLGGGDGSINEHEVHCRVLRLEVLHVLQVDDP